MVSFIKPPLEPKDPKNLKYFMEKDFKRYRSTPCHKTYSPKEALALILGCGISRADYQTIRKVALEKVCRLYTATTAY